MSMLLDKPVLGPLRVDLRDYQMDGFHSTRAAFGKGYKRVYAVMATGLGKTIFFGYIARKCVEKGGRVLVLAHMDELISQAVNKLDLLGIEAAVEQGPSYARASWPPDVVVATVQTMKGERLRSWPSDYFSLIIVDECHHSTASSYVNILDHFDAKVLGVTATPKRSDDESIDDIFEHRSFEYGLIDGMKAPAPGPYLCRLEMAPCPIDIDLRDIKCRKGDFSVEDLEARITPHIETLANSIRQEIGQRLTIIFTPDVASCQGMATALGEGGLGLNATWTSGADRDRKGKMDLFEEGHYQILCVCQIGREGLDIPKIASVVPLRPTKSALLMTQMIGRGTRPKPDGGNCLVLDFNYLCNRPGLVSPLCVFDSERFDPAVLTEAERILKMDKLRKRNKPPGSEDENVLDLLDVVQRAERVHRDEQIVRIRARERKVQYKSIRYDPLAVYETMGIAWRGPKEATINRATPGQIAFLKKLGIVDAEKMSKTRAHTLLDFLVNRMNEKRATVPQVSHLIANGVDPDQARAMTKDEASEHLGRLWGNSKRA